MEWLLFAIGIAVIGLVGIGLGLVAGRAWARRADRRSGDGDDEFMTPVGPPSDDDAGAGPGGNAGATVDGGDKGDS